MLWVVYKYFFSPLIHLLAGPGFGCRYLPSCGDYAEEAFRTHGSWRGSVLSIRRVMRCHPWGGSGYDAVPLKEIKNGP